jgi:hypothetical protein
MMAARTPKVMPCSVKPLVGSGALGLKGNREVLVMFVLEMCGVERAGILRVDKRKGVNTGLREVSVRGWLV